MTWPKVLKIGGVVLAVLILLPMLAIGILLMLGQEQYRALTERVARNAAGTPVAITGPFELDLGRTVRLSADDIVLGNPDAPAEPGIGGAIGRLRLEVALPPLLHGRLLVSRLEIGAADLTVVDETEAAPPPSPAQQPEDLALPPLLPILADILLEDVRLRLGAPSDEAAREVVIERLTLAEAAGSDGLELDGEVKIDDVSGRVTGAFGPLAEAIAPTRPFPVSLSWRRGGVLAQATGTVAKPGRGQGLEFKVSLTADEFAKLGEIPGIALPELGPLAASARISGDAEAPALDDVDVVISGPAGPRLQIKGAVGALHRGAGVDLSVALALNQRALLRDLLERAGLPAFGDDISKVSLAARLGGRLSQLELNELVVFMADEDKRVLEVKGRVGDLLAPAQVDLELFAQSVEPSGLRQLLPEIGVQVTPTLVRVRGTLKDADGGIRLDISDAKAVDVSGLNVGAKGHLTLQGGWDDLQAGPLDIRCDATAPDSHGLARLLGWELPQLGPISGRFAFTGDADDPDLTDLDAGTTGVGPIALKVTARRLGHLFAGSQPTELDELRISLRSDRLQPLLAQVGVTGFPGTGLFRIGDFVVPDPGNFKGEARLELQRSADGSEVLVVEDLHASLGEAASWKAEASGRIGTVTLRGPTKIRDIQGTASLKIPDAQAFTASLGLPEGHPVEVDASAEVSGELEALQLSKLVTSARFANGLTVRANGRLAALLPEEPPHYRDLKLALTAHAPAAEALQAVLVQPLPALGAVQASGRLEDAGGAPALQSFELNFGPKDEESLSVAGRIGDLAALRQISIQAAFASDVRTLTAPLRAEGPIDLELPLHGAFSLSDADGTLGIDVLDINSDAGEHMHLDIQGSIADLVGLHGIDLQVALSLADVNALDPDLEMGPISLPKVPLKLQVKATGERGRAGIDGTVRFGETALQPNIELARIGERLKLSGKISSPRINLGDLGWPVGADAKAAPVPDESAAAIAVSVDTPVEDLLPKAPPEAKGTREWLIPDEPLELDGLKAMDLDLKLRLGEIHARELFAHSLNANIRLDGGRLGVTNAIEGSEGGRTDTQLDIDAAAQPASFALRMNFHDIHAQNVVYVLGDPDLVEGLIAGDIALSATGASPRELATTLGGSFELSMGQGRLNAADLRLLSPGLFWILDVMQRRQYTDLECGLFRFDIAQGVFTSKAMLLMATDTSVAGAGQINLADETLDIAIAGSGRQVLPQLSKPFRVHGPLGQPAVSVGAVGVLADTALNVSETAIGLGTKIIMSPLTVTRSFTDLLRGGPRTPEPAPVDDGISRCVKATADAS